MLTGRRAPVRALVVAIGVVVASTAAPAYAQSRGPRRPARAGAPAAGALARAPLAKGLLPPSRSYVLVDAGTGEVLAGYREHLRVPPASLTKVITALVAVTFLAPTAKVPGTAASADVYPNQVGIEKGVAWPLADVLQSLLVFSANDAAYALAQRVSGSLARFSTLMQEFASWIGMSDRPLLLDPAGLDGPEGYQGGNLVSARDLAIAGRDLLDVPELAAIVKERGFDFVDPAGKPHDLPSMNDVFLISYRGAVGIKTGFTDRAGDCIMAAATRHGRTMIAVVMDGYNPTQTAIDLLDQGFATPVRAELRSDHLPAVPRGVPARSLGGAPFWPGLAPPLRGGILVVRARGAKEGRHPGLSSGPARGGRDRAPALSLSGPAGAPGRGGQPAMGAGRHGAGQAARSRHGAGSRRAAGLVSVLRSALGQALLALAGMAALLALWELLNTNRPGGRRRRVAPRPPAGRRPSLSLVTGLSSGRRRREQLLESYRRHERPARVGRPSAITGRR